MVESSGQLKKVMTELRRVKTVNEVKRVITEDINSSSHSK